MENIITPEFRELQLTFKAFTRGSSAVQSKWSIQINFLGAPFLDTYAIT